MRFSFLFLGIIVILSAVSHLYALSDVPNGLYQDETAIGYNAYSLLVTGKDEHGVSLPLYFRSFGDYKLPVYIYSTIPSIMIFGLTPFAVRLPSAIFGVLSVLMIYFFVFQLFKRKDLALFTSLILAIVPWHIHYSRATFEVSICLFLYLSGGYFLLRGADEKKGWAFVLGTALFVLNMYTYNLTRLLTPLLYVLFLAYSWKEYKKLSKSVSISSFVLIGIGSLPFLVTLFGEGGAKSASGTLIHSSAVIQAKLLEFRSYLIYLPLPFTKLFFNTWLMTLWVYLEHITSYLSVSFFFLKGSLHGNHGIGNSGQFYLFMLPLFLLGSIRAVLSKKREWYFLVVFSIIVILVASLTREAPHATRSYFLLIPWCVFIAYGASMVYSFVRQIKQKLLRTLVVFAMGVVIGVNIVYYLTSYFVRFPVLYAPSWRSEDDVLADFLVRNEKNYENIIVDESAGNIYTSLLFYLKYSPMEFHNTSVYSQPDSEGFLAMKSFGKYGFQRIDWENLPTGKNLFITTSFNYPENSQIVDTIMYPVRPVVSALGQEIVSYPVEDVAYVISETE